MRNLKVMYLDPPIAALKGAEYVAILKRDCGWMPYRNWSSEASPAEELTAVQAHDISKAFGEPIIVPARILQAA